MPDMIEGGLRAVGLDWSAVGSVIVTHKHPDHWIGLSSALERAADAVVFAGAEDIPHIASPRRIVAVGAGDRVMDLAIIPTPGHPLRDRRIADSGPLVALSRARADDSACARLTSDERGAHCWGLVGFAEDCEPQGR